MTLSSVTLSDSDFNPLTGCAVPGTMTAGQSYSCVYGPVSAVAGQHVNTATASGIYSGTTKTDTDLAHYQGQPLDFGDAPTAAQSGFVGSYPTTLAANAARHAALGPTLGQRVTPKRTASRPPMPTAMTSTALRTMRRGHDPSWIEAMLRS